jgi:hypothetical protein
MDLMPMQKNERPETFHHQIGKTLEGWSFVESALCTVFIRVTQMHPPMARKIFYSGSGFASRAKMLRVAIGCVNIKEDGLSDFFLACIAKAETYANTRNEIAHGDILLIQAAESIYSNQYIIIQGKEFWKADPDPKDVITHENLEIADNNFRRLGACLLTALAWDGKDAAKNPSLLVELVRALPSPAKKCYLDSEIAKSYNIDGVGPAWR